VAAGRIYNIGNPRSTVTVQDLARMIIALADSSSAILFRPRGHTDVSLRIPDISAAKRDLGYEPVVELEEGLRRTIAWYRARARPSPGS
jgi:nucleoside-diphosphate-sugar epimerase